MDSKENTSSNITKGIESEPVGDDIGDDINSKEIFYDNLAELRIS